jgi:hypothetical protein
MSKLRNLTSKVKTVTREYLELEFIRNRGALHVCDVVVKAAAVVVSLSIVLAGPLLLRWESASRSSTDDAPDKDCTQTSLVFVASSLLSVATCPVIMLSNYLRKEACRT